MERLFWVHHLCFPRTYAPRPAISGDPVRSRMAGREELPKFSVVVKCVHPTAVFFFLGVPVCIIRFSRVLFHAM